MIVDALPAPVILAPLAGGPSTPELAAAVSDAGGMGFVAAGYLTAAEVAEAIAATRALTANAFGVNVFCPGGPADPGVYQGYLSRLGIVAGQAGVELGVPRFDDDQWQAKLDLLVGDPVPVVSFTFGCPSAGDITRLQSAGSEVWVTVTSPAEARQASAAGADLLVVQGGEAGGHRASFIDRSDLPIYGLLPLLQLIRAAVDLPLVASGGIATGAALAATLCAGAAAGQLGTAFLRCPEAGTSPVHRQMLAAPTPTALTRCFTGRLARGIRNRFIEDFGGDAPIAYPEIHHATAPLRKLGRARGDAGLVNLWAGEAHEFAQERTAADLVRSLAAEAQAALAMVALRLGVDPPSSSGARHRS